MSDDFAVFGLALAMVSALGLSILVVLYRLGVLA